MSRFAREEALLGSVVLGSWQELRPLAESVRYDVFVIEQGVPVELLAGQDGDGVHLEPGDHLGDVVHPAEHRQPVERVEDGGLLIGGEAAADDPVAAIGRAVELVVEGCHRLAVPHEQGRLLVPAAPALAFLYIASAARCCALFSVSIVRFISATSFFSIAFFRSPIAFSIAFLSVMGIFSPASLIIRSAVYSDWSARLRISISSSRFLSSSA